jgi:hypothetical protein
MKTSLLALALAAVAGIATPAMAQSYEAQQRWDAAQARYQAETDRYQRERDLYYDARARDRRGDRGFDEGRYATDYDASRYYRDDPRYQERRLGANDQVYRGSDGRYYCKRSDGTTGLIVGAAAGGILGNVIDGGRHRVGGTLIGGALGAILGKSVDQNSDVRCR